MIIYRYLILCRLLIGYVQLIFSNKKKIIKDNLLNTKNLLFKNNVTKQCAINVSNM